jgi:hypothetical protein
MLVEIESIDKGRPITIVKVEEDLDIVEEESAGVDTTLVDSIIPVHTEEDNSQNYYL